MPVGVQRGARGGVPTAPGCTALVAASLAAWSLLSATTPTPKRTPPAPLVDKPDRGGDDGFRDLWKTPF